MNAKFLLNAIGHVNDELIIEYDNFSDLNSLNQPHKTKNKKRKTIYNVAIAACCCILALGSIWGAYKMGLFGIGGAQSGGGTTDGRTYMFYEGPVLPLTFMEKNQNITAERNVVYDFTPYRDVVEYYESGTSNDSEIIEQTTSRTSANVTDSYKLKNETTTDITVKAIYPYTASLRELMEKPLAINLDGHKVNSEIMLGQYSGSFTGVWGSPIENDDSTFNLLHLDNWLGYKQLLEDGSYLKQALQNQNISAIDQEVIVYDFSNFVIESGEGEAPSLAISYKLDENAQVITYGFNGMEYAGDNKYTKGFFLPNDERLKLYDERFCLIVLGGDISDIEIQGYENLGFNKGTEMEITTDMTRSKTTLDSVLRELMQVHLNIFSNYDENPEMYGTEILPADLRFELIMEASYDLMQNHGLLSEKSTDRYSDGFMEDIFSEAESIDRIIYFTFDITIPAAQTTELTISLEQRGSHDFYEKEGSQPGTKGYDLTTNLGSNILFTKQAASIEDHGLIEIVEQNFNFDLSQNIRTVELEKDIEYYYMLIRKLHDDK